jgi:diguanylate cyclase (GGDEF)-like protein/PAS domain S-box-containing protein
VSGLRDDADGSLASTLALVTETITACLGFEVAVMNLIDGDTISVVAVSGSDAVRRQLLGMRQDLTDWHRLLEASEPWGQLRFLDHRRVDFDEHRTIVMWVPDLPRTEDPDAWHPDDALFAPLMSSTGEVLGMLSVDVPRSGRKPSPEQRRALEAFGVTASLAIEHATLAARARAGERRFEAVFDSSPIAIALLAPDRTFLKVNDAFCQFLNRGPDVLVGRDPKDFTHPDDVLPSDQLSALVRTGDDGGPRVLEKRYLLPSGEVVWGRLHLARLNDESEPGILVAQVEDITLRKAAEESLRAQAHHDSLTGLPNRVRTMQDLAAALQQDADGRFTAVFFCDLDNLKWLNDTHGHAVGDDYLREVSRRIAGVVRASDTVGRLGGDEFVVVLPGMGSKDEVTVIAERVLDAVGRPWRSGEISLTPCLSLGIAYAPPGESITADELLSRADAAMYQAKTERRGSWRVHPELSTAV